MKKRDELGAFLQSWEDYMEGRIPYDQVLTLDGRKMGDSRINPWAGASAPAPQDPEWETVTEKDGSHPAVYRLRVPGGWLYRLAKSSSTTFVPDR